jgi:hypothetical protein
MKNKGPRTLVSLITAAGALALAGSALAVPYACDITNSAGTVSFRLNEAADNVKVISSGGAVTNDLGPGLKGLTVTNLGVAPGVIKIMVTRSAPLGYTQTSVDLLQDTNSIYVNKFEHPRGVVVDKNPASPSFGRIYVANARVGTTSTGATRTTIDGIYMINSDDTVALDTGTTPRTGGIPFTTGTETGSPLRLTIGKNDNMLYICDLSDPSGGLWVTDLDVETNALATNVLWQIGDLGFGATNHGSIYAAVVEGSLGSGNLTLFTMDEDLTPTKTAWRYDMNSGPLPSTAAPVSLGQGMTNTAIDLVRGGSSNYLYASQNDRTTGGGPTLQPSLRVFKADGTTITNSLDASRQYLGNPSAADLLQNTTALDISPDGTTLALLRGANFGTVLLVPLTNGIFNFAATNSFSLGTGGASDNNRDIAYDAVGNLYVVQSANEWFRIFSKGGASLITSGTDGSLVIGVPPTLVSVTASTPTANEQGPVNGVFTLSRTGDSSVALTVNYTIAGTATPGADYTGLPGSVTFLPGSSTTNITVQVLQDSIPELTETVVLTISGSANYGVTGGSATVSILDNEPTEISITPAQDDNRLLEGFSEARLDFTLTRRGLIGPPLNVNLAYGGTAVRGVDFNAPASVAIGAGDDTATISITPIDDELFEGDESLTISVASGLNYAVGATNSASAVIVDDDYPAGAVLFSDNFETDSSANWILNSNDGGVDSSATFGYDYSQRYVPPVPGGSSTKGLLFRLNEQTGAQRNSVSISPLNINLPGQYRLKFKMWNNYNGPMFDGGSGSTMHMMAGVGTTPDHANLATSGASDGIWFDVDGDGGSTFTVGDANAYAASSLYDDTSGVYAADPNNNPRSTTSPYYSLWGNIPAPAAQLANYPSQSGISQPGNMGVSWHTVVLTKTTNSVTWVIDGILIATVPADATALSTNVFVGFEDIFPGASGVPAMSFALVENLRVETYVDAPIMITSIKTVGGNAEIVFTGPAAALATGFKLQSSPTVNGTYSDDNSASITQLGAGPFQASFKATTALSGDRRFYKIKR